MVSYGLLVSSIMGLHPYFRMKQLLDAWGWGLDARQKEFGLGLLPALYTPKVAQTQLGRQIGKLVNR